MCYNTFVVTTVQIENRISQIFLIIFLYKKKHYVDVKIACHAILKIP